MRVFVQEHARASRVWYFAARVIVLVTLTLPAAVAAQVASRPSSSARHPAGALTASAPTTAQVPDSTEVLRPGDLIRLRIWREPDLSGDFPVDEKGMAVLPKLGPVAVTGIRADTLRDRLVADYTQYLNHPSIEVMFLHRVQVVGAVRNPGLYPIDPTMTLSDALALAGGVAPDGNQNRVLLIRNGEKMHYTLDRGSRLVDAHIHSGDQLYVPERSWVSRNPAILATLITAGVSLLIAFRP
jgi:polysaccharide export outer membrane protein